jgi:hypothetical protein
LLSFVVRATDADLPPQQLRFALGPGAPSGASIDPTNGVFRWRPTEFQGGTNYSIQIIVTDSGTPALSATQSFVVTVVDTRADFLLHVGETAVLTNAGGALPLTLQSGTPLSRLIGTLEVAPARITNLRLTNLAPQVGGATLVPLGDNRYRIEIEPRTGQSLQGTVVLAELAFDGTSDPHSAVVLVTGTELVGQRVGAPSANGRAGVGRVFIVGPEPILDLQPDGTGQGLLVLYALPRTLYTIEQNDRLIGGLWRPIRSVTPGTLRTELGRQPLTAPAAFYRVRTGEALPLLTVQRVGDQVILEWLAPCEGCELWQSPVLGAGVVWTRSPVQPQLVGDRYRVVVPVQQQAMFFRLLRP